MDVSGPIMPRRTGAILCERCAGAAKGLCHNLDDVDQAALSAASTTLRLPARSAVFREGDRATAVFTLVDGAAKLLRSLPDGRQQIIGFRFPGDFIGYTARERYPCDAELVTVPDTTLPSDLALTTTPAQHLLISVARAQTLLGWTPGDPTTRVAESVRWHLAHPPPGITWTEADTAADDAALTHTP